MPCLKPWYFSGFGNQPLGVPSPFPAFRSPPLPYPTAIRPPEVISAKIQDGGRLQAEVCALCVLSILPICYAGAEYNKQNKQKTTHLAYFFDLGAALANQ